MKDESKTKAQLITDLRELRRQLATQQKSPSSPSPGALSNEADEIFPQLLDSIFEAIVIHSQGRVLAANKAAEKMYGYQSGEMAGKQLLDFVAPESHGIVLQSMTGEDQRPYEIVGLRKDGSTFINEGLGKNFRYRGIEARVVVVRDISDRKLYEKLLKQRAEVYRTILEEAPEAIAVTDPQGYYIDVSQKMLDLHGYSRKEEMIGKSVLSMVAPEDLPKTRAQLHSQSHPRGSQNEYRLLRKDGSTFWGQITTAVVRDEDGKEKAIIGITRDITERKEAEEKVREAAEFYRAFMQASPDAVALLDLQGNYLDLSPRTAELLGYERAELIGKNIFNLTFSRRLEISHSNFQEIIKEGGRQKSEYKAQRKDGSEIDVEISTALVRDKDGKPQSIIGIARDITERKRAENQLKEVAELFQAFMKASPDVVSMVDMDGHYVTVSQRWLELHGFEKPEEVLGRGPIEFIAPQDLERAKKNFPKLRTEGGKQRSEYHFLRKDGSVFIGEVSTEIANDAAGNPKAIIGITRDITERKRMEEALQESETKYRELVQNANSIILRLTPEGNIAFFNEFAQDFFGYREAEILGRNVLGTIVPETDSWGRDLRRMLKEILLHPEEHQNNDNENMRRNGERVWINWTNKPVFDSRGKLVEILTVGNDITEQKKAQEAVRESMELYQSLIQASPDAVIISDLRGNILEVSERGAEMHGTSAKELIGKNSIDLIVPEQRELARRNLERTLKEGLSGAIEYKMMRADGAYLIGELNASLVKDAHGNPKAFIAMVRDITKRKQAEAALRESEERFRGLVGSMDDIVVTLDREQRTVGVFGAVVDKYPDFKKGLLGKTIKEIYNDSDDCLRQNSIRRALKGQNVTYDWNLEFPDQTIYLQTALSPIFGPAGRVAGLVGVVRNVTQIKKLEENLVKAEKLESLGILAGGIAHDFNNILTAIVGNISLAKALVRGEGKAFQGLDEAERAAMRARDLALQLLTFSKGGAPIKKTVSLAELLKDSSNFILRGTRSKVELSIPNHLWPVLADESQITQVFHNLLINADQAMPNGGTIKVSCENFIVHESNEWRLNPGNYVRVTLSDQGLGISKEDLAKIFDPYFTTKQRGSGLGLTITYSIVKRHNGCIYVDSEPGKGTSFKIYLPASDQELPRAAEEEEISTPGRGRVLVMDDDEGIRRVASNMLEHIGYEVVQARDGSEAVALYKKFMAEGKPFALVLMDLVVPVGMGGLEAMELLGRIDPKARVLVSSGYSTDPVMSDFRKYGFCGVVTKPYGIKKLRDALAACSSIKK